MRGWAMRWGAFGSIGLIAFMGCTGPVVAQQTQSGPRLASSNQPAPPPNWTGPQVGGFGGGSFGSPQSFVEPGAHLCAGSGLGPVTPGCFETPFQFSDHRWSPTFGAFAGYNAQFGNLVVGVEGDAAWKRISTSQNLFVPPTTVDLGATRTEAFTGSMTQRWTDPCGFALARSSRPGPWPIWRRGRQCMQLLQLCCIPDYRWNSRRTAYHNWRHRSFPWKSRRTAYYN